MAIKAYKEYIDEKQIYDLWIEYGNKQFPSYMDFYEHLTGKNIRNY